MRGLSRFPADAPRPRGGRAGGGCGRRTCKRPCAKPAAMLLRDVVIFDVYTGNKVETGSKSVALGLILQDTSRTLTDADVDGVLRDVTACLSREFNAAIRE